MFIMLDLKFNSIWFPFKSHYKFLKASRSIFTTVYATIGINKYFKWFCRISYQCIVFAQFPSKFEKTEDIQKMIKGKVIIEILTWNNTKHKMFKWKFVVYNNRTEADAFCYATTKKEIVWNS